MPETNLKEWEEKGLYWVGLKIRAFSPREFFEQPNKNE
jgi:hypothetical protein